jgi:hypothetical protein
MARLWTSGFEWQSVANGREWQSTATGGTGGNVAINTSIKRSGAASIEFSSAADASNYIEILYNATDVVTYIRIYAFFQSFPTSTGSLIQLVSSGSDVQAAVGVRTTGVLELFDGDIAGTSRGTSSALDAEKWYGIELKVQNGGSPEIEARVWEDGVNTPSVFASGVMTATANANTATIGMADFVADCVVNIDDCAINDTSGTAQTSYPGEGRLVMARPTGAGDNAADLGDATAIDDTTPNDATDFIDLDTNTSIGDYAMTDSSSLGIDSFDNIKLVQVLCRIREESAATTSYQLRLKSASGGTTSTSTATDAGNTTWRTNPASSTTPLFHRLISYTDPTTTVAWTPTGTNSIDNMQVGVASLTANDIDISTLSAYIEYTEGTAPGGGAVRPTAYMTTNTGFWGM